MSLFLRMLTGSQNPEDQMSEEQVFYEFIFRLFKENKVEIASAIKKPFPLLMGLRDRGFIPEQMFQVSKETFLMIPTPPMLCQTAGCNEQAEGPPGDCHHPLS